MPMLKMHYSVKFEPNNKKAKYIIMILNSQQA